MRTAACSSGFRFPKTSSPHWRRSAARIRGRRGFAWTHFGAGSLTNPEAFLYAAGSVLGDRRPLPFAIRRTSAPGTPLEFEGQPEPPGADALAYTVGEAMALHMWWYDGVHDETLTDEFRIWWSDYAARRLLPPLPDVRP